MNMTEEREIDLLAAYAPLGIPVDLTTDLSTSNISNHVLLVNEDYLTGQLEDDIESTIFSNK